MNYLSSFTWLNAAFLIRTIKSFDKTIKEFDKLSNGLIQIIPIILSNSLI